MKLSIGLNIVFLVMGCVGYIMDVSILQKLFVILTWAGVVLSPFALLVSPFVKKPMHDVDEMWFSRFTDVVTIIILAWAGLVLLPVLVVIELVILELAWRVSNQVLAEANKDGQG